MFISHESKMTFLKTKWYPYVVNAEKVLHILLNVFLLL